MLHSRLLIYLDEVARSGSFRKAASRLNVASSAINRQILALERDLGAPIFDRLRKRLRLTATGELLIAHVRATLKEHERLRGRIEALKGLRRGEVTIATMAGLATSIVPPTIASFRRRYPGVSVNVRVLPVDDIVAAVASGEVDLGLGFNLPRDPKVETFAATDCRLGAVLAPRHPLTRHAAVPLSACVDYPLILAGAGLTLRKVLDDMFASSLIKLEPALETNSIELMKQATMLNLGIAFLTNVEVREELRRGELAFVPLRNVHLRAPTLRLVYRAKGGVEALPSLMAETLKSMLDDIADGGR
jgi:DNA-binding transcriptional LysR family regulator